MGSYWRNSAKTTLDASGNGQVSIAGPGVPVTITHTVIVVSSAVKEPRFLLYVGGISPTQLRDTSYSGSQDVSDTVHRLQPGQTLIGVWVGGDPGASATMNVDGETGP